MRISKVLGIVAEYNPFHLGHAGHLARSLEKTGADAVIAVMSGNFVQRGEPALCDKWLRTRMALEAGVDVVLELPVAYATASAEYFAKGAVRLLSAAGAVDCICFGSEMGELEPLQSIAQLLLEEPPVFKTAFINAFVADTIAHVGEMGGWFECHAIILVLVNFHPIKPG